MHMSNAWGAICGYFEIRSLVSFCGLLRVFIQGYIRYYRGSMLS